MTPLPGKRFLGAEYDANTATYSYKDGSGQYPEEMRHAVLNQLDGSDLDWWFALNEKDAWKARLKNNDSGRS